MKRALEDDEPTYESIRRWMHLNGHRLVGPKRELYRDRLLEIQFPFNSRDNR